MNDVAVLYQTFDRMDRVYLKVGETSGTRFGTFHHNDLIGRPWGIKVWRNFRMQAELCRVHLAPAAHCR